MHARSPESLELEFCLRRPAAASKASAVTESPAPRAPVPRIAQVLALAIFFEEMVRSGEVADYAEVARLGCVSRERISQIMKLRWLAPDIQRAILTLRAQTSCSEAEARQIADRVSWSEQRKLWLSAS